MKRMMEGEGIAVDEKYGSVGVQFTNCSVVLASNDLPFERLSEVDKGAFKARIVVCTLPIKTNSLKSSFPFSARQLADFFVRQYEHQSQLSSEAPQEL